MSDLGTLAYQNSASGSFTPSGSVSVTPTTDNTPNMAAAVGSMSTFTVSNEVLTITAGSAPTLGTSVTAMTGVSASFSGTAGTVIVN